MKSMSSTSWAVCEESLFCNYNAAYSLLSGESPLWQLLITSCSCYPRMNNEQTPTCRRNTVVLNGQEILFKFLMICNIFLWLYQQKRVKRGQTTPVLERKFSAKKVQAVCPSVSVQTLHCSVQPLLQMRFKMWACLLFFIWIIKLLGLLLWAYSVQHSWSAS